MHNPTTRYNFQKLKDGGWLNRPDSDPQKWPGYQQCLNGRPTSEQLAPARLAQNELAYLSRFLEYYQSTNVAPWREQALTNLNAVDGNYYRTVCNLISVAVLKGVIEQGEATFFRNYEDRFMAVIDDYEIWGWAAVDPISQEPRQRGFWVAALPGYTCALAAALLWDKFTTDTPWDKLSGHPGRTPDQKRAQIRAVLLDLAQRISKLYNAEQMRRRHALTIQQGNSQGEETAWNAAYLALISQLLPRSGAAYLPVAQELACFACSHGPAESCVMDDEYIMENHGIKPHPQYGMSLIMFNARAGLPFYQLGNKTREAIPAEFRMVTDSRYNLVNCFEANSRFINFDTMTLQGDFVSKQPTYLPSGAFEKLTYLGQSGVSEWGFGADFNISPLAYLYINDRFNSNRYRSTDSPLARYSQCQKTKLANNTLYLPPTQDYSKEWSYIALGSTYQAPIGQPLAQSVVLSDEAKANTHFFVNSMKAFEHLVSFLYYTDKTYLTCLE